MRKMLDSPAAWLAFAGFWLLLGAICFVSFVLIGLSGIGGGVEAELAYDNLHPLRTYAVIIGLFVSPFAVITCLILAVDAWLENKRR